jgi:hypothetical protein
MFDKNCYYYRNNTHLQTHTDKSKPNVLNLQININTTLISQVILLDIFRMIGCQTFQVFETWKVYAYAELKMSSSMLVHFYSFI